MNQNLHFVHVIPLSRVERYQVIRPQDTVRVEWFLARFSPEKQHFIHHSTLRNVMLWKKAWRKRAFGKKKQTFVSRDLQFHWKKKNNNNKNDNSKAKTKKQRELKKNRKSSHEETALVMSCLTERKFPLPFYKCATRILFLNKWKPETSILSGQDKHWTLCYLLMTGFFLNLVLFFLLSIFVSFWHFLTWPRPCTGKKPRFALTSGVSIAVNL